MSASLPERLDPWRAAQAARVFTGTIELARLPRLAEAVLGLAPLAQGQAEVCYRLAFERDPRGRVRVFGDVDAVLRLPCQRCLGEVAVAVSAPLRLALVRSEQQAEQLDETLDPVLVEDDEPVQPLDWIEDELLLAIPAVPRHAPGECEAPVSTDASPAESEPLLETTPERDNPFAILASLKSRGRDDEG
ncbi:YceD family protein [Marichromatium gracile]|uniref:YceD family protein n=1 Tax=Marichromatium gracile TaxID=1048 RepID=UPI001F41EEED|nr:YceD family protein [Marichromatium gracile]MCF1182966.1 YceD family protein [Marichromatium gracile]